MSAIDVQVGDAELMDETAIEIAELPRERHRVTEDDFTILAQADFIALVSEVTGIMTILLGSIAGISLVVGGIGVMNIMLVSVTERTREIGLRKAVGAKKADILFHFRGEAMMVSGLGGALGVLLGVALSRAISGIDLGGTRLMATVTPDAILLAVGVSVGVGVFFGIYPAFRAASLNPIQALRYE